MNLYQWLTVFAVPGIIAAVCSFAINRAFKKRDKIREEVIEQNRILEGQNKATMLGVQALLRNQLLISFRDCLSKGFAEYNERETIKNMYVNYEALGPNSVMDDLYKQFTDLPMQK